LAPALPAHPKAAKQSAAAEIRFCGREVL